MSENEKRQKFIKELATTVDEVALKKMQEEEKFRHPSIGDIANGYRSFIYDLGGGFLDIAEMYEECLKIAKENEIIGEVQLKARIKDFSSSYSNTNVKMLDDVFGMELVTSTEVEKEILILFTQLLFEGVKNKDKKYNKKTGYIAYHYTGDFSPKEYENLEEIIKEKINKTKTKEYIYSKSEPNYNDKKDLVNVFPKLMKDTTNYPEYLKELTEAMREMLEHAKKIKIEKENIPVIEMHFLTKEVEQEAIRGSASHDAYKKTNTKLIEEYFMRGRLIRGINAPWKFVSNGHGLKLQDFYETILENWPFLRDEIVEKRKEGREEREKNRITKFDKLTASQFPFLRKYIEKDEYPEELTVEKWGLLKTILIANRIDYNDKSIKSIGDGLVETINEIWE